MRAPGVEGKRGRQRAQGETSPAKPEIGMQLCTKMDTSKAIRLGVIFIPHPSGFTQPDT